MLRKDREGRITALEVGGIQDEEDVMENNVIVAAIAGLRGGGPDLARSKAFSAARVAEEGELGLSPISATDILRVARYWYSRESGFGSPNGQSTVNREIKK